VKPNIFPRQTIEGGELVGSLEILYTDVRVKSSEQRYVCQRSLCLFSYLDLDTGTTIERSIEVEAS